MLYDVAIYNFIYIYMYIDYFITFYDIRLIILHFVILSQLFDIIVFDSIL